VTEPAISVIMSAYNAEAFIGAAIESMLSQSFRDFEFLIVNDGSKDATKQIIERYAARDARIRLIDRENKGLIFSLNQLIQEARGELLARMDADDISHPERLAKQAASQTGAALDMKRVSAFVIGFAAIFAAAAPALARDQLHIVGSSTVYPFSTTVAESLAKQGVLKSPVVEATGTGGGIKLFCEGVGEATPDMVGASRMTPWFGRPT